MRASAAEAQASALRAQRLQAEFEAMRRRIAQSADDMARVGEEVQKRVRDLQAQIVETRAARDAAVSALNEMTVLDETSAGSEAWSHVSKEWAEHMPDTIPPNILAMEAITGDHWSSRWWANRSANAFGMLAWW